MESHIFLKLKKELINVLNINEKVLFDVVIIFKGREVEDRDRE